MSSKGRATPHLVHTLKLVEAMRLLAKEVASLDASFVEDGVIAVRVVGEFSSGKTRFIRELLQEAPDFPGALLPLSSPEPQTALPLEITYGANYQLDLVERESDEDPKATYLERLPAFPGKERLESLGVRPCHRLRLQIPDARFVLQGSGKRFFLIDTPGWNAAVLERVEIPVGGQNLALIFVISSLRLEHGASVRYFIEHCADLRSGDFIREPPLLILVITNCEAPPRTESEKREMEARSENITRLRAAWGGEDLEGQVEVVFIDFEATGTTGRQAFRDEIWGHLLKARPKVMNVLGRQVQRRCLSEELYSFISRLEATRLCITNLLNKVRVDGKFLPALTPTKLNSYSGRDFEAQRDRQIARQLGLGHVHGEGPDGLLDILFAHLETTVAGGSPIAGDDPLFELKTFWLFKMDELAKPFMVFLQVFKERALALAAGHGDYQAHWEPMYKPYQLAEEAVLKATFPCVVQAAMAIPSGQPAEKILATMMKLSLMETLYVDYKSNSQERVAGRGFRPPHR